MATDSNRFEQAARFRAGLRRFLRRSEDVARANGLTPRQHLLLLQIGGAQNGTSTVTELVDTLALTQSAVTELVQRAELAGLVLRTPSNDDRRVTHLTLTRQGAAKLAAVHDALGAERAQLHAAMEALDE